MLQLRLNNVALLVFSMLMHGSGGLTASAVDKEEDQALPAVERLGGEGVRDEKDPARPIVKIDLSRTKASDADLRKIARVRSIRSLILWNTRITNEGLKELAALDLQELGLQ